MQLFIKNLANLLMVKTLITLSVIATLVYLSIIGKVDPKDFIIVVMAIITYYFTKVDTPKVQAMMQLIDKINPVKLLLDSVERLFNALYS